MNDRFTELMVEANNYTNELTPCGLSLWQVIRDKKFAELIVKECMTLCDETKSDYLKYRKSAIDFTEKNIYAEGEAASDIIKYKLKKRFGVE